MSELPASALDADRFMLIEREDRAALAAVRRIGAVPTILKVICEVTGLRLALISRVTQDTWTACAVLDRMNFGLSAGDHLEVATTLCSEVRAALKPIVIEHASREPEFRAHPTPRMYGIESYIAVPIVRPNGEYFGNVCALDSKPAALRDGKTLAMMRSFAELVGLQLADEEAAAGDRRALLAERETAELREQFIAVLGHDLRSPLQSILAGTSFLLGLPQEPARRSVLECIHASGERMAQLVNDVMDFARGRLGVDMPLTRERVAVTSVARQVVSEIAAAHPERVVRLSVSDERTALVDPVRGAQLVANLVANAVEHGAADQPVDVDVCGAGGRVRIAVTSRGRPIPADVMPQLFHPFVRGKGPHRGSGLGLGLHIASEVARAHGGEIRAESTAEGVTTFMVELPGA